MSLKKNIAASYISQIYVTVIGIVLVPLYIKYMGAEAYGLVGFFAMLQAWFNLLDLGLTPTIARESARYHGGALSTQAYRQLLRVLTVIFLAIAFVAGCGFFFFSDMIATRWINANALPNEVVVFSLQLMALNVAMRFIGGLFRASITGAERLVWLSGFSIFIATLRSVIVFASMAIWGYTPTVFFLHQLIVGILELIALYLFNKSHLQSLISGEQEELGWSFSPVRKLLKLSLGIAFSSTVWIMVTQIDKLILSGILSLSEYGYFTLAVLLANGVLIISAPVTNSIIPRMARLHAEKKEVELIALYRDATQLVVIIAGSAAIIIALFSKQLLFAWTGDMVIVDNAELTMKLYAIGNVFLTISAFPYYLQYARGELKFHNIGNALAIGVMIPSITYFSLVYGASGAAWTWMLFHLSGLLFWTAYVHKKLCKDLHWQWLTSDVIKVVVPAFLVAWLINLTVGIHLTRAESLTVVFAAGIVTLFTSIAFSSRSRSMIMTKLRNSRG